MSDFYSPQSDSVTHSSIVHELLKKIVTELGVHEFRGFFVLIGVAMLGIARPSLAIIFGTIGLLVLKLIGLVNIGTVSIVAVSAVGIILLMRVGRE